ncbi:hypothetical protein Anapl_11758 [Anas platyrhynchos]|uniref:Uncharacterized protein n=1 Tax=Anas platyrhynchos TaxID=8839 RepID=R0LC83_ANAPL|nr:hypothetical protein Anapl_11758 [Anas platyrhynchos]
MCMTITKLLTAAIPLLGKFCDAFWKQSKNTSKTRLSQQKEAICSVTRREISSELYRQVDSTEVKSWNMALPPAQGTDRTLQVRPVLLSPQSNSRCSFTKGALLNMAAPQALCHPASTLRKAAPLSSGRGGPSWWLGLVTARGDQAAACLTQIVSLGLQGVSVPPRSQGVRGHSLRVALGLDLLLRVTDTPSMAWAAVSEGIDASLCSQQPYESRSGHIFTRNTCHTGPEHESLLSLCEQRNSVTLQKDVYVLFLALCGLIKLGEKNAFLVKRVGRHKAFGATGVRCSYHKLFQHPQFQEIQRMLNSLLEETQVGTAELPWQMNQSCSPLEQTPLAQKNSSRTRHTGQDQVSPEQPAFPAGGGGMGFSQQLHTALAGGCSTLPSVSQPSKGFTSHRTNHISTSHSKCKTLLDEEESSFPPPLPGPTGQEVWPHAPIHDLMMHSVTWLILLCKAQRAWSRSRLQQMVKTHYGNDSRDSRMHMRSTWRSAE